MHTRVEGLPAAVSLGERALRPGESVEEHEEEDDKLDIMEGLRIRSVDDGLDHLERRLAARFSRDPSQYFDSQHEGLPPHDPLHRVRLMLQRLPRAHAPHIVGGDGLTGERGVIKKREHKGYQLAPTLGIIGGYDVTPPFAVSHHTPQVQATGDLAPRRVEAR